MIHTQLPPLNAVRAFDAVVQQGSVGEGAALLCISQSAVSRHIKNLEDFLGCRLMQRHRSGIVLTAKGAEFHEVVHTALVDVFEVTTKLRQADASFQIVRVSAPSSFALSWLVPRIAHFQINNVGIALDVSVSDKVPEFADFGIDCAVVSAAPGSEHDDASLLFAEELQLVCAPSLLAKTGLSLADDINDHTLLHTGTRHELWNQWRQKYGVSSRQDSDRDLVFQDFYIAIAAAVSGIGLALVPSFLVQQELATGQLVAPLKAPLSSGRNYHLVIASRKETAPALIAFKQWMVGQSKA